MNIFDKIKLIFPDELQTFCHQLEQEKVICPECIAKLRNTIQNRAGNPNDTITLHSACFMNLLTTFREYIGISTPRS
jgi:hypothetical protein